MDNPHNLPAGTLKRIETLDANQLKSARRNLKLQDSAADDEVRKALAERISQGGNVDDLVK
jgi:hypothetical protein